MVEEIKTARLTLRKFNSDDLKPFNAWSRNPAVTKFLKWPPHMGITISKLALDSWIDAYNDPSFYNWAIVLNEANEAIGSITVVNQNEKKKSMEIGFCIAEERWGNGYTTEALKAVIAYLFTHTRVNRIECKHDPNNTRCKGVLLKSGLTYEGTLREASFNNTGVCDLSYYSILRREFEK